ncbi:MAG: DUF4203 domain-containing protein [Proteobacteria bacterium]|nr:DUF4203 domain-containing protein [Pseudomonadota bacterium]
MMNMNMLNGLIGLLMLTLGRKLFWLFVGGVGFVAGLQVAQQYFGLQPEWVLWAVALAFGLIGALLAVFFQTIAIVLGGFAAGSTIAAYLMVLMGVAVTPLFIAAGGIIGAILLYVIFDWALIGLSSLAGATLIVQAVDFDPQFGMVVYVCLVVVGVVFQASLLRRQGVKAK